MERAKVKEMRGLTERSVFNGQTIMFSYEQGLDKKTENCAFAVFKEKNDTNPSSSVSFNTSGGFVSVTLHKKLEKGDLLVIGEAIKELENILTLKEAKAEEVAEEKVVTDEASASK